MKARELDCFYTSLPVAQSCLDFLKEQMLNLKCDLWLEPSAGKGVFLDLLPKPRLGLDVKNSAHPEIEKQDFLKWTPSPKHKNIIVIGNPPFGKNSSLAVQFFNQSAGFAQTIALILPKTFQKESIINRLHPLFHLKNEKALPNYSFTFKGNPYCVPCVFQIWSKKNYKRQIKHSPKTHQDFHFVPAEQAEFALQRVGVNAGRIKFDISNVAPSSHYFLKMQNKKNLKILQMVDWSEAKHKTAGNPSLAKTEVVSLYEEQRRKAA